MCIGICKKCGEYTSSLQKHHIYPKRFFGENNNPYKLRLCDTCHKEIELLIPRFEVKEKSFYAILTAEFLCG